MCSTCQRAKWNRRAADLMLVVRAGARALTTEKVLLVPLWGAARSGVTRRCPRSRSPTDVTYRRRDLSTRSAHVPHTACSQCTPLDFHIDGEWENLFHSSTTEPPYSARMINVRDCDRFHGVLYRRNPCRPPAPATSARSVPQKNWGPARRSANIASTRQSASAEWASCISRRSRSS